MFSSGATGSLASLAEYTALFLRVAADIADIAVRVVKTYVRMTADIADIALKSQTYVRKVRKAADIAKALQQSYVRKVRYVRLYPLRMSQAQTAMRSGCQPRGTSPYPSASSALNAATSRQRSAA
jgi:hypothetical protein